MQIIMRDMMSQSHLVVILGGAIDNIYLASSLLAISDVTRCSYSSHDDH
jgi:hypothetical protein